MAGLWSAEEYSLTTHGVSGASVKCEFTCSYLWGPPRDSGRRSQDDCSWWWMVIDDEKCIQAYLSANSDETLMRSIRSRCDISLRAAGCFFFVLLWVFFFCFFLWTRLSFVLKPQGCEKSDHRRSWKLGVMWCWSLLISIWKQFVDTYRLSFCIFLWDTEQKSADWHISPATPSQIFTAPFRTM